MEQSQFEKIEQLWRQQDERLQRIEYVQQESVRRLLDKRITTIHRRFLTAGLSAAAVCILAEAYLLVRAGSFFGDQRLALPYIAFNVVWCAILVWTVVWAARICRHDPLSTPVMEMLRFADRWRLCLRRTLVWGVGIVTPVCVAIGLPVVAHLFGHTFHYSDLQYLATWRILAAVAVYVVFIVYTIYEMRLIRELKANLRLYDELLGK